jgi:hypothetical protein
LTVGGLDDSNANPVDPYALPANDRTDDELYDLLPFVSHGDTSVVINTTNPSLDDNIFFAALFGASVDARTTPAQDDVWVPPPANAAAATIATAIGVGASSLAVAAADPSVDLPNGKVTKKISGLLPKSVKKWLATYIASKRKLSVTEKTGSTFVPNKPEALVYCVSLAVLTFSFSYVKVNTLAEILIVLPTIFATSVLVAFVKTFVSVTYARSRGVWTENTLWYFGLAVLTVTTFAFRVPFSYPSRIVNYAPKLTKRLSAVLSSAAILISLAFAGLFYALLISGFTAIGSAGLAMCVLSAFFDTWPIAPLKGKKILDHSKILWTTLFITTLIFYAAWLLLL